MKKSIYKKYFNYVDEYQAKYGKEKTIVMMQVGTFYEFYFYGNKNACAAELAELLNVRKTMTTKKKEVGSENPNMVGFPVVALLRYLKILIDNGFLVVQVDEIKKLKKKSIRKVTAVHTQGMSMDQLSAESNNIVSIYLQQEKQIKGGNILCVGMCSIDLSTGKSLAYEIHSKADDEKYALDEIRRFMSITQPKEILINTKSTGKNKENIENTLKPYISYLELKDQTFRYNNDLSSDIFKVAFQNELLKKIYTEKDTGLLEPIDYLGMEKMPYCTLSLVILIDFVYSNNPQIIQNIQKPEFLKNERNLILGNDAVYQLNILENSRLEGRINGRKQFRSLFDVVNMTSTSIGKRFLKEAILNPLCNEKDIQKRYDSIEGVLKFKLIEKMHLYLSRMSDIERLHRKMNLGTLHPAEFPQLHASYLAILKLIKKIEKKNKKNENSKLLQELLPNTFKPKSLKKYMKKYQKVFNLEEIAKYNLDTITNSFIKKGVNSDIDTLQNKIEMCRNFMNWVKDKFEEILGDPKSDTILIKQHKKEGYYLLLTTRRADNLKQLLKKELKNNKKGIKISDSYYLNPEDLQYKKIGKGDKTKILFEDFGKQSDDLTTLEKKIGSKVRKFYEKKIQSWFMKNEKLFKCLSYYVGYVDFIKSGAQVSQQYNYVKPKIKLSEKSYIQGKKMRHPIIERISTDTEYMPHSITLGKDIDGLLVYGINGVGKSSIMKMIGLLVVMAQTGMYVPAKKFTYHPYDSIYARITSNDNLFKGLSSFQLEMVELRPIIKRSNKNTLVIGDEICRGTEYVSGTSIVTKTVDYLAKLKCSFIFASHLHSVSEFPLIKELKNVKSCHLTVENGENETLIFDRKLKDGHGEQIYGITIAKHILHDNDFMDGVIKIKNQLLKNPGFLNPKKSKYNKTVYMHECKICKETDQTLLETHHIIEQKNCINDFSIEKPYIPKNVKSNLVILCKKCHLDVHHGDLIISGYKTTTEGVALQWKRKLVLKRKIIKKISNLRKEFEELYSENLYQDTTLKQAQEKLKKTGINVPKLVIEKIWKGKFKK